MSQGVNQRGNNMKKKQQQQQQQQAHANSKTVFKLTVIRNSMQITSKQMTHMKKKW